MGDIFRMYAGTIYEGAEEVPRLIAEHFDLSELQPATLPPEEEDPE